MDKYPRYWKHGVLRCPPEKRERREMNKIAHVFLQMFFKFQTREICFKEHSRIRLATIYIYPHTCTSWSKSMTFFSLYPCFDFAIYAKQVGFHIHPYLSSIEAFRSRQKEGKVINALVRIQKYHIYRVIWEYYERKRKAMFCFVFKSIKMLL